MAPKLTRGISFFIDLYMYNCGRYFHDCLHHAVGLLTRFCAGETSRFLGNDASSPSNVRPAQLPPKKHGSQYAFLRQDGNTPLEMSGNLILNCRINVHLHLAVRSAERDTSWWRGLHSYGYPLTYRADTSTSRYLKVRTRPEEMRERFQIRPTSRQVDTSCALPIHWAFSRGWINTNYHQKWIGARPHF